MLKHLKQPPMYDILKVSNRKGLFLCPDKAYLVERERCLGFFLLELSNDTPFLLEGEMNDGRFKKGQAGYWLGKKRSEETKEKIRQKNAGKIPWNKGKKLTALSEEIKRKMSITHTGKHKREKNNMWKGGIKKTNGYVYILKPEHPHAMKCGYIPEHRLVMEKHIGRYLKKSEVIHHRNEIRDDNEFKNLVLYKSQEEHIRAHNAKDE